MFAHGAKTLSKHPSKEAVQRATTRVLNDLAKIKKSSPVKEKYALLYRIGRMLKSVAYRAGLLATIAGGSALSFDGFNKAIYSVSTGNGMLTLMAQTIKYLVGMGLVYSSGLLSLWQLRRNLSMEST